MHRHCGTRYIYGRRYYLYREKRRLCRDKIISLQEPFISLPNSSLPMFSVTFVPSLTRTSGHILNVELTVTPSLIITLGPITVPVSRMHEFFIRVALSMVAPEIA